MSRTRILCVDDEPLVLEGLTLHLRRRYTVQTATSGAAALDILRADPGVGVIISDMRMPGMDGATFLRETMTLVPDAVRILLTGHTDIDAAIRAVNDGHIFRFLMKPCAPARLTHAVDLAAEQHRLVTAERVLLQETLHGSIATLVDVLSLTNPAEFGRAMRVKQTVTALAVRVGMASRWQVEVAAMLSQLGTISLPPQTAEKLRDGRPLAEDEAEMVERAPAIAERLLAHIPRLETARAMLAGFSGARVDRDLVASGEEELVRRGAQLLRIATDFDVLLAQGRAPAEAVEALLARGDTYDAALLEALARLHGSDRTPSKVRDLPLASLQVGMVLAEDVRLTSGTLLAARGYQVTLGFVERARNFGAGMVKEPVRVVLPVE
jgi:DNA-binding NarL/FixJ family response regulator